MDRNELWSRDVEIKGKERNGRDTRKTYKMNNGNRLNDMKLTIKEEMEREKLKGKNRKNVEF